MSSDFVTTVMVMRRTAAYTYVVKQAEPAGWLDPTDP
jgi:hypothetical protein